MAEEVINYSGNEHSTWFQNKKRGLFNRYHKYKRYLLWEIHTRLHSIDLEATKLPTHTIPIIINNFNRLELLQQQKP